MTRAAHREPTVRLADHPFFHGFDPSFLTTIAHGASERTYETGEFLVREGEPATEFFLVQHGKVAVEMATPERPRLTLQTVGPGEVLGWSWFTPPRRWSLDARALKTTRALVVDAAVLRRALDARPDAGYRFLARLLPVIAERLENARLQLLDIHGV